MLSPCLEGDLECGPRARPELAAVCLCEVARRVSRVGGLQRAAQLRCLETELVFPAASCKQPFRRSRRSLKEGFISLGSSRRIFTQWAPERRREQTCFFFLACLLVKWRIFLADLKALETNPGTQSPAHSRHSINLCCMLLNVTHWHK